MIDIHNHLLFGIDDGSKSIEESVDVLRDLASIGYTDIILTPHYISGSRYSNSASNNYKLMKELESSLKDNNIDIKLYLGNEIFIDDDIFELLLSKEIYPLNGTKNLLIELPMSGEYEGYLEIFSDLIDKGCNIILAHPERYLSFQKDYKKISELASLGVFFQCNLGSLLGKYGSGAKKLIKKMLKDKKVTYLATDIHHKKHDLNDFNKAKKIALKYISEIEFNKLVKGNPSLLLN
jgi:protein-tyrosine phosphatase